MCPLSSWPTNSSASVSTKFLLSAAALIAVGVALVFDGGQRKSSPPLRELSRSQLELRDGQLFAAGEVVPFNGTLVERYSPDQKRVAIAIRDGKPHGVSRGWYENGEQEVEEHFVAGVSHGKRTRWYEDGSLKSEANIVSGKIEGTFTRWHANGARAAEAQMRAGKPHGVSRAWDRAGTLVGRADLERGRVMSTTERSRG